MRQNVTQTGWQPNLKVNLALLSYLTPEILEARALGGSCNGGAASGVFHRDN